MWAASQVLLALVATVSVDLPAQQPRTIGQAAVRAAETVIPNDNRVAAGSVDAGVLRLRLDARFATWRPDLGVDSTVTVMAFAEEGLAPRIPGPLLRAHEGTEVHVSVRNSLAGATLVVHGLRAGTVRDDTLHVAAGTTRDVRFRSGTPGTYVYWGTTDGSPINKRMLRDGQLTGAIVIDPAGVPRDTSERIFVMTVIDIVPTDSVRNPAKEDIWELAINGRSWPHTERLEYAVGETVRWRWINGSYLPHPMHLHGFHFRVLAKGDGGADTTYAARDVRDAATELMEAGSSFRMEWTPTRAGSWLMHCHMLPHISPFPNRPDNVRHAEHDVLEHPLSAMAGLVVGITTVERATKAAPAVSTPAKHMRLYVQERPAVDGTTQGRKFGFVLQQGAEPAPDSVRVPGTPLVLTRGETTAITVVNRLRDATTVHWHGMELESVFDGVSGWSRTGSNIAPLIAAGDSFTVAFTPPRAGTFIYHTHMDEGPQLPRGLYGALIVLEPGQRYDPATDLAFIVGRAVSSDGRAANTLNGKVDPPTLELHAGTRYRLRFINIHPVGVVELTLSADSVPISWQPVAKDGAAVAGAGAAAQLATMRFGAGETFDFDWTPARPMDAVLRIHIDQSTFVQTLRVR
jgi:FtsP/CotA-like multicopper oxidase with cupredoxin domain